MPTLRRAELRDAYFLWELANVPAIRWASFGREEISWADHLAWVESTLLNRNRQLWIVEGNKGPIGQIREDKEADGVWISIALVEAARGEGTGSELLRQITGTWDALPYWARVRRDNEASVRAFQKAGYHIESVAPTGIILRCP